MNKAEEMEVETEDENVEEKGDILDSSVFSNAKMFSCTLCDQKFTNKLKITIHWSVNHSYKLCGMCTNYAFRYDSDKIQHERQHIPFGCSSCEHEFNSVSHNIISEHYKKAHQSFLCMYCSSVIEPFSMFPEHIEKKHNVFNYSEKPANEGKLYELIGDAETGFFFCNLCNKKKRTNLLFGHYVFYHNLSLQSLKDCLEKLANVRINGSLLNGIDTDPTEAGPSDKEICNVCETPFNADSNVHEVFCQGYVMCQQKECDQLFENKKALTEHLAEHPTSSCKFGCREINLKTVEVDEHLQKLHDIVECSLCDIVNSSGNLKNHLRDKHSVNLMTYEKAISQSSSKLYRVEKSIRNKRQVLCNFCDHDITKDIREFSFVNHYQEQHDIHITAILRNLDKNPIIDVIISDKKAKVDEECFKNFDSVLESSVEEMVDVDFDASKVYCIGSDKHLEQKPQLSNQASLIACDFCNVTDFDASCRLYEHMTKSHGFRLLNVKDRCETCQINIQKENLENIGDSKSFNLSLVCPIDESSHVTKGHFNDHILLVHSADQIMNKTIYKCFECNFVYNQIEEIRRHFNTEHPEKKTSYCRICRYNLTDARQTLIHFNLNHADDIKQVEKFRCKLCNQSKLFSRNKARCHYESHHKKKETIKKSAFKCQFESCIEAFENKDDRKMHQMIAHPNEKLFVCKSCPLKFSTKSSLSSHNLIHKNVINTCQFCQKTFIRRDSYKEHLLIHSGVRQKCSFCEKSFVQRSNLVRHERIHLNEKPYKCSYCDKMFSDKGACTSHEKVHTKSEHSNCEVCGKHFARKQKLKYHMRIHTLENVLTCDCGKIFTESYSFRKHKETHLKKRRTDKCSECGKIFKSAKAKNEHIVSVHGLETETLIETKIQCTLCNIKGFSIETIKVHLTEVHNIEDTGDWETYIEDVEFEMEPESESVPT